MISERVARLRQRSLDAKPCISTERAELMTEVLSAADRPDVRADAPRAGVSIPAGAQNDLPSAPMN